MKSTAFKTTRPKNDCLEVKHEQNGRADHLTVITSLVNG